jgi:hypothetical protein
MRRPLTSFSFGVLNALKILSLDLLLLLHQGKSKYIPSTSSSGVGRGSRSLSTAVALLQIQISCMRVEMTLASLTSFPSSDNEFRSRACLCRQAGYGTRSIFDGSKVTIYQIIVDDTRQLRICIPLIIDSEEPTLFCISFYISDNLCSYIFTRCLFNSL